MMHATILLANEPRAYRETLALALTATHPHLDVHALEPADLDREVAERRPLLVVSSEPDAPAYPDIPACVLLYPDGARLVVIRVDDEETVQADLDLTDLLALIERLASPAFR